MLSRFLRFACCHASVNDLKLLKILVVLVFAGFYFFFFFFKYFVTRSISLIRRSCFVSCYHELNSDINITRYYMVIYVHRNNDYEPLYQFYCSPKRVTRIEKRWLETLDGRGIEFSNSSGGMKFRARSGRVRNSWYRNKILEIHVYFENYNKVSIYLYHIL